MRKKVELIDEYNPKDMGPEHSGSPLAARDYGFKVDGDKVVKVRVNDDAVNDIKTRLDARPSAEEVKEAAKKFVEMELEGGCLPAELTLDRATMISKVAPELGWRERKFGERI